MIPHGKVSSYNRGCRCSLCRSAASEYWREHRKAESYKESQRKYRNSELGKEYQRKYRQSLKGQDHDNHGTTTGYSAHSCRCDECRKAQKYWSIEYTYGLKPEEYDQILMSQSGLCAICKGSLADYSVIDHCHATGKVRGVLCSRCNSGIGKFKDSPDILSSAIRYLKF